MSTLSDLQAAHLVLHEARLHDLEAEVLVWSLKYMQEDPTMTIEQALICGYQEWIK